MASHAVHPSATFIRFSLGSREDIPVMLAGPSNADLADPGQGALNSLAHATAALLTYESQSDSLEHLEHRVSLSAMVFALKGLSDFASAEFVKVHRELEDEIRKEKGTPPRVSGEYVVVPSTPRPYPDLDLGRARPRGAGLASP